MPKKTALYDNHIALGGNIVDFFGWQLPLNYGSQLEEHQVVREKTGIFDVSHMTVVDLLGAGCRDFLRNLLANDIDKLSHHGKALYSCMLNHRGGIIDDLIVYSRTADHYRLVLNAATRDSDLAWLQSQANGTAVGIQERVDVAMLAVQGPGAEACLQRVLNSAQLDAISTLTQFESVDVDQWFFACTGYTGEDGFEIILPKEDISRLWTSLLESGAKPCGLGSRDSLRLEAGLLLSGQDMDDSVTPLESALAWTIAWQPEDREFVGRAALEMQKQQGVKRKLVGLLLDGKQIMRHGYKVYVGDECVGEVTSGGFSPTLQRSIALARLPVDIGEHCHVEIRKNKFDAQVVKPRFVKNGQSLL